ncbi:MAG TPA: NUDIX domain-containing protein [Haloplasmataceae bacterium]
MEIYYKRYNQCFNLRVAAVIKKDDKIIFKKHLDNYYTLPGGRVRFGETTEAAIKRIIYEDFGLNIKINRLLSINENFFSHGDDDYHEVLFIYHCELTEDPASEGLEAALHSVPVEDLLRFNIKPRFLIEELKRLPLTISHTVNK